MFRARELAETPGREAEAERAFVSAAMHARIDRDLDTEVLAAHDCAAYLLGRGAPMRALGPLEAIRGRQGGAHVRLQLAVQRVRARIHEATGDFAGADLELARAGELAARLDDPRLALVLLLERRVVALASDERSRAHRAELDAAFVPKPPSVAAPSFPAPPRESKPPLVAMELKTTQLDPRLAALLDESEPVPWEAQFWPRFPRWSDVGRFVAASVAMLFLFVFVALPLVQRHLQPADELLQLAVVSVLALALAVPTLAARRLFRRHEAGRRREGLFVLPDHLLLRDGSRCTVLSRSALDGISRETVRLPRHGSFAQARIAYRTREGATRALVVGRGYARELPADLVAWFEHGARTRRR